MKLADVDSLACNGPLGSSRVTSTSPSQYGYALYGVVEHKGYAPNSRPYSEFRSILIHMHGIYIHVYYLIHGFFSSLPPSPARIFRLAGGFHSSRAQHRHVHPGHWTLDSRNTHWRDQHGDLPKWDSTQYHRIPYGLVICSPEFVLQWNQWVESVYSGVLRSTYRPYGVLYTEYLGEGNVVRPISIPTPSLATCHPLDTTLINSSRWSHSGTVGPKVRSPDLAISHVVGIWHVGLCSSNYI